ncbi:hypothetical protein CYMTET_8514 [Cymbomonas tetramitiformis]|uniref:Uncharacterized protein n=1 Tax=Cymbomonas tetramitiformis TaxID=36881 RepID=A0AAE0GTF7_9CHLO|nr:hypothetical protein CYMTET_8514 [Cymbomonas tetramitiformis]
MADTPVLEFLARTLLQPCGLALAAADRTRANGVFKSTWAVDVVKRVAKDTLGNKGSSFSGSEPHRRVLWDSVVSALQQSFVGKEPTNDGIFDLVDVDKEVNPICNDLLLRALVSLTTPHSPARRRVEASARISPKDGKRALLEVTKRLLVPGHRPLRHHEELLGISFGPHDDPEPLVSQFDDECIKAIAASWVGALEDRYAKRQLFSAMESDFYREVITPLRLDTELDKVSWRKSTPMRARSGGEFERDMRGFMEEFDRVVRDAAELLASLMWRDERNRRSDGKFHGQSRLPYEANSLLYSALADIVNPNSAAGDWLDACGAHFLDDGKRALLEVVRPATSS